MKALAILISPTGEEFYDAYGPMTKRRDKATRYQNGSIAAKAANNRFGRGETGFWNSERAHFAKAKQEFRGWSYRIEEVDPETDDNRSMWYHLARNEVIAPEKWLRLYVKMVDGVPTWTETKDEATEWPTWKEATVMALTMEPQPYPFTYST